MKNIELLLINLLIPQLVGLLASFLSGNIKEKYSALIQPPFSPPALVFPIVWFIIYILMGFSAYFVFSDWKYKKGDSFFYYSSQLAINFLWPIFFFGLELRFFSIFWSLLLTVFIVLNIISFYKVRKISGFLLIPYLIWSVFALYLTFGTWILNK